MSADGFRYVVSPTPLHTHGPEGRKVLLALWHLVQHFVEHDARFNNSGRGIRMGGRLLAEFSEEKPFYRVHPDDWKVLADVAEEPGPECGYPVLTASNGAESARLNLGPRLIPFLDAIASATTEQPAQQVEANALS
jgi:hypothetical protein